MSETTGKKFNGMFCEIERCKHCNTGRCVLRSIKEFMPLDIFRVSDLVQCHTYDPKPPKQSSITLNEDEATVLLQLLAPSSDEGQPNEELYNKIYRYSQMNPIASSMFYINIYERCQQYGGPEEGGWWYHTTHCCSSVGYACADWNTSEQHDFSYLLDMFFESIQDVIESKELPDKEDVKTALLTHDCYQISDIDRYDEGTIVAIERQPGAQHSTQRQYYC